MLANFCHRSNEGEHLLLADGTFIREVSELSPEILNETYKVSLGIGRGSRNCFFFAKYLRNGPSMKVRIEERGGGGGGTSLFWKRIAAYFIQLFLVGIS